MRRDYHSSKTNFVGDVAISSRVPVRSSCHATWCPLFIYATALLNDRKEAQCGHKAHTVLHPPKLPSCFDGPTDRRRIPAVLLVSALFGSIHLLNAFITGDFGEAWMQSLNAFLSGFGYLAMRIRTRSLIPIMIGHWLWDLAIFLSSADPAKVVESGPGNPFLAVALVAPIALYGLWLLRKPEYRILNDDLHIKPANR